MSENKLLGKRRKGKLKQLEEALEEDPAFTEQFEKKPEGQIVPGEIPEKEREPRQKDRTIVEGNVTLEEHMKIDVPGLPGAVFCNNPYLLAYTSGSARLYDLSSGKPVIFREFNGSFGPVVVRYPTKHEVAFAVAKGDVIALYTYKKGRRFVKEDIIPYEHPKKRQGGRIITGLAFNADGKYAGISYNDNFYGTYSVRGWINTKINNISMGTAKSVEKIAFDKDDTLLVASGMDILRPDSVSGRPCLIAAPIRFHVPVKDFSVSDDVIALITEKNKLYLRYVDIDPRCYDVKLKSLALSVDFSPDGKHLAVACADENVYVYEVKDRRK